MYIINQLKNQFSFVKLNFNEIGPNGPREIETQKPELKKNPYSREAYLNRMKEKATQSQKEKIGKGITYMNKVVPPQGVDANDFMSPEEMKKAQKKGEIANVGADFIDENTSNKIQREREMEKYLNDTSAYNLQNDEQSQSETGGNSGGQNSGPDAKSMSMSDEQYDKRTKTEKPGGQFSDIQIDGKPLDAETYKKMTAEQFSNLPRDKAFQLMQVGDKRIDTKSIKSGEKINIGFPNKDSYLHISASSFPENIRSLKVGDKEYFREGKNGEFFDEKGHRLVIGNKDLKTPQELTIGQTYDKDTLDKMTKAYDKQTADAFKKYGVKNGTDKAKMIRASIERGISPEELNMWLNRDKAGVKKLSKAKQLMLNKNEMYLKQQGLIPKETKEGKKANGAETQKKKFEEILSGDIKDTNFSKKDYKGKDGKTEKALYSESKLTVEQLDKTTKGLDNFTLHIPKEGEKSAGKQQFEDIVVMRKQTKEFGKAKSQLIYGAGDKKGKEIPKEVLEKAGVYITGEGIEKKK